MPKTYSEKLKDPRRQKKRLEILDSAGWRCEDCGCGLQDGREFHVHHTAYISGKDPHEYGQDLLMSLCVDCHERRQKREDALRVGIGRITRRCGPGELEACAWRILDIAARKETEAANAH